MVLLRRANDLPTRLGILPGTFNPPTRAHFALARAALTAVDQVMFVLPRSLPHKTFDGATFEERREMLLAATEGDPRLLVAESRGGLMIEIARECREQFPSASLAVVCGRDAAERILTWRYEPGYEIERQLREYQLLVAARQGAFQPPPAIEPFVRAIPIEPEFESFSSTAVRERAGKVENWRTLVPEPIADSVARIYGRPNR
jgi:cytidyltransferase-like protein